MKPITCYETSDGQLFKDEENASKHQYDIIGELLDDLLPYDDRGNVTQADRFNLLIKMLADKELLKKVTAIYNALTFEEC